jgi:hypothetical protein
MAEQNGRAGNGQDTTEEPGGTTPRGKADSRSPTQPEGVRAYKRPAARTRSGPREPPVNAIQASRKPRKDPTTPNASTVALEGEGAPTAGSPAAASTLKHADSDPWTVPQSVRDRFVQDGHRFFFPNGEAAFKDLGRKLTTASENT